MAPKKPIEKNETIEETGIALANHDDLDMFAPSSSNDLTASEAGLGVEEIGAKDVVLPRVSLLQALSGPVKDEFDGAEQGVFWLTPFNRPLTEKVGKGDFTPMRFVVVRIYPSQRRWTPLDSGGGLECEATARGGQLVATNPEGLAGAKFHPVADGDVVTQINWEGGHATDRCNECVYGPGAANAALGKPANARVNNPWLPKIIGLPDGRKLRIEDKMRAPRCQAGLDALILVAAPAFGDQPAEVIPAFVTFSRGSFAAGRTLAGMVKLDARSPAWGKIYELRAKKIENDKGAWYIPTVQPLGFANELLRGRARELYDASGEQEFRPSMDDVIDAQGIDTSGSTPAQEAPPSEDEPVASDQF